MSEEGELLKSPRNGTGHILQDLLSSSTVILKGSRFFPRTAHFPVKIEEDNPSPELMSSCSICSESGTNLSPLALQEMEILTKFVLSQEQISLILQTEDHPPIFCCKICSSVIHSLAKLSTQIENITISLRAVISSRNGLFFSRLKKEFNISESSHEVAPESGSAASDQISNNGDDNQQLTGWFVEEEFSVKVEPLEDDDQITTDPLYQSEPAMSESDDDDDSDHIANSVVEEAQPKYVCKICQPNITFATYENHRCHMKNKRIHPDGIPDALVSDPKKLALAKRKRFVCKICNLGFTRNTDLGRHLRNKKIHPDISEDEIAASSKKIERPVLPRQIPFPCTKCTKTFTSQKTLNQHKRSIHEMVPFTRKKCATCHKVFTDFNRFQRHMRKGHDIPSQQTRHPCTMCSSSFSSSTNKSRHVERVHFRDKTSCPYGCESSFGSDEEWVTHLEGCDSPKMSAESGNTCRFCPAVFRNLLLQIEHHLRVHPYKTYSCSKCGHKCTRQSILQDHRCITV